MTTRTRPKKKVADAKQVQPPVEPPAPERTFQLQTGPVASSFVLAVAKGTAREIGCFGPRGESKTQSALIAMGQHAQMHQAAGYALPVPWVGITDTFNSHKEKTIESLNKPHWQGAWRTYDDGHRAILRLPNQEGSMVEAVSLSLFGIEDSGAIDRARRETCGAWMDEPAPTTSGAGVPELAWDMIITSQRVPSHAHVAVFTSNYPDEDHWTWQRFQPIVGKYGQGTHPEDSGRMWFQIPRGDNPFVSDADRAEWWQRLEGRPDLQRRLLEGRPGVVRLGPQVAYSFDESEHVSFDPLAIQQNEPIVMGWDGGHTPVCIIGQDWQGDLRIYAALTNIGLKTGTRQLAEGRVIPWFSQHAPWAMRDSHWRTSCVDPSMNTAEQADIEQNPVEVIHRTLGGWVENGPVKWAPRYEPLLTVLGRRGGLKIDASGEGCDLLIKALRSQWYFPEDRFGQVKKDAPKKPNHPWEDLGDALCYFVARCRPSRNQFDNIRRSGPTVISDYNPMGSFAIRSGVR